MALVFFQLRAGNGDGDGIYAQARIEIGGIGFNIVYLQAELSNGGDEVLQIQPVLQLQMDFKVVAAILQIGLERGEQRQAADQRGKARHCHHVQPCAQRQPDRAARPETYRGGQSLDLALGGEQNGVRADDRHADEHGGAEDRVARQAHIQRHGDRAGHAHQHECAQAGGVALGGALAADDSAEDHRQHDAQQYRCGADRTRPCAQQRGDGVGNIGKQVRHCIILLFSGSSAGCGGEGPRIRIAP